MYFRSREGGGASSSYFRSTACTLLELLGPNDGGFCALATCPALLLPVIAVRSLLWVFGAGCSVCQLASGQSILNFHVYVSDTGSKSDNIFSTQKKHCGRYWHPSQCWHCWKCWPSCVVKILEQSGRIFKNNQTCSPRDTPNSLHCKAGSKRC